jgi:hypothetical protein
MLPDALPSRSIAIGAKACAEPANPMIVVIAVAIRIVLTLISFLSISLHFNDRAAQKFQDDCRLCHDKIADLFEKIRRCNKEVRPDNSS